MHAEKQAVGHAPVDCWRWTVRVVATEGGSKEEPLRKRLRELTAEVNSLANRRLGVLLRREGWAVNHNRVYQLYREEGLAERRHNRVAGTTRVPLRLPTRANQVWTMGFAQYTLASEWKFRTLNLMDITAGPEGRL